MEDLKTIKERGEILTEDEMIVITDKVCADFKTLWAKSIANTEWEFMVIKMYEAVNREATKKILNILENENENGLYRKYIIEHPIQHFYIDSKPYRDTSKHIIVVVNLLTSVVRFIVETDNATFYFTNIFEAFKEYEK